MSQHSHDDILVHLRRNKWTLGYISAITTVGLFLKVYDLVKG